MLLEKIKNLCKKRGKSISCLEREANLSNGAISKWNISSPTLESLRAVARVLEISLDELTKEE